MSLPNDIARCAGRAPFAALFCTRRHDCARYLADSGPRSPFYLSVCEEGEAFIHVATVDRMGPSRHPHEASPTEGTAMGALPHGQEGA